MQKAAVIIACLIVLGIAGFTPEAAASSESKDMAEAPRPLDSRERQRVKKLATDLGNSMQTLNQGGILPFQDPAYAEKWRKLVGRYRAIVTKYPQSEDPDVLVAVTKLAELKNMVAFGVSQAGKQTNDASDAWTIIKVVQTILAKIENDLQTHRAPQWLTTPFTEMEAREWRQVAANARETAHDAISELQRIAPDGHLAVNLSTAQSGALNNKKDLDRLLLFAIDSLQEVDAAFKHTFNTLQSRFYIQNEELDYYRKLDPEIEKHRINAFSNDGAAVEIYAGLDRHLALAQSLNAFSNAYDKRPNPRWKARIDEIIALRKTYSENRLKVLGASKLPIPKSTDAARIAIAEKILAEPGYEYGEHGPIVLTTKDIVEREKLVSRAEIKDVDLSLSGKITLSGTETTWNYKWQEFKFATPLKEKDSDDWYIWWITAKKYSSGWERTPIGEWVSGATTKGDLILKENFGK